MWEICTNIIGLRVANLHYFRPRSINTAGERERVVCCSTGDHCIHTVYSCTYTSRTLQEELLRPLSCAISWVIIGMSHTTQNTRYTGDTPVTRPFMSDTSQLQAALWSFTYWKSWFTIMKHCLILLFLKINTHKVTQDSTGFNSGNRLNPILISAFFLAHFVDKKKLPLKSHGKTIINILNYLQSKH